ncbi:von Willebrand factor type A domain-containing protein [Olivibacter sp. SDN3]|nr:von Willebrand factor type A domain-containing protein [Olivibacter sp. SDN3]
MKTNFFLWILLFSLVGFKQSDGDNRTISGTVYSKEDQQPLAGVAIHVEGNSSVHTVTDEKGHYAIMVKPKATHLIFKMMGFNTQKITLTAANTIDVWLEQHSTALNEIVTSGTSVRTQASFSPAHHRMPIAPMSMPYRPLYPEHSESYQKISENGFLDPRKEPLSTFAVDVDAASYSNVRRLINGGQLPPKDAVRIEEMINYFQYELQGPGNSDPVAIHTELSVAPWNRQHHLLRIGLKAKSVDTRQLPPSHFVFLLDVSGSMVGYNRLPLVKSSMKMLVDQLREKDQISIVTYAGTASLKLEKANGNQKIKIKDAIDALEAGGATAGGAGLKMAYRLAREHFIKGGNNRIILASDGDFNVGASSDEEMEDLVSAERQSGVSLSVFGFGMGNLKDSKMEILANKGHGNYAYIDHISEARKAMITEFGATLFTVAKDVKMQVEFNPAKVQAYRLIGYENRLLEKEDFNNDQKLGGDMGVGHTVTALYEIVPVGVKGDFPGHVDPLKYQDDNVTPILKGSSELATVKFRYKKPDEEKSQLKQVVIADRPTALPKTSDDFRFTSAVAELGMLLRNSAYKQQADYNKLITRAKEAKGIDEEGYRAAFIQMAEDAKMLAKENDIAFREE